MRFGGQGLRSGKSTSEFLCEWVEVKNDTRPWWSCNPSACRHVVLPQEIAQLLPKGRLLSEVSCSQAWLSCRGRLKAVAPLEHPCPNPASFCAQADSPQPACMQNEWRALGVQQSRGWVHYAIHRPEPHIMLYR